MNNPRKLSDEDQKRVDEYLHSGYNRTEKKPYKPLTLLFVLWVVVTLLGIVALALTRLAGIV